MLNEREDDEGFRASIVVLKIELIEEDAGIIRGELLIEGEVNTTESRLAPPQRAKAGKLARPRSRRGESVRPSS